jgi:peptidyl-prolyl cis-trans isomerase C
MMNKTPSLLLAALLASFSCAALAQNIAKINGVAIPMSRADAMVKEMAAQGRPDNPQLRQAIKEELINREIMMQEASKLGLAKLPEVETQLEFAKQNVLVRAYIQDYFKRNAITDEQVNAEYNKIKQELGAKEYRTRHILVKTEEAAKGIITKLKAKGKFEDLAKASEDPGSKDKGGDLDWATAATFVPEFSQAMIKLKKGEFTDTPVKSQFGYHVIRLDDMRDTQLPSIEEAKPRIMEVLQRNQFEKMLADLRTKATIE